MSKAEDLSRQYVLPFLDKQYKKCGEHKQMELSRFDGYDMMSAYEEGYHQAKKDLLENKHETSWRLDEKLWSGIKDVEEASYQYMYDASNDWAYDIPTWKDVQDAFKAGSEWKEGLGLTWEDIPEIFKISEQLKTSWWFRDNEQTKQIGTQIFWEEVLKRFKENKSNVDLNSKN